MRADQTWQYMLSSLPRIDIPFNGDCAQALGVNLPIAVINLAHRTDRWQAISGRMQAVGLNKLIKVPAVEGAKLALDEIAPLLAQPADLIESAPSSHYTMTRPAVGCFLSHVAVWQWMIRHELPRVLVFEDDAYPVADFKPDGFRSALGSLPGTIGMVLLGRIIMNGMAEKSDSSALARIYYFNGTFAYLITPAAAQTLMSHLLPMNGHIDHQISKVLIDLRDEFSAYYFDPPFFEPDWSLRSDCYVPLVGESEADRELGNLLAARRRLLLDEGRPLLAPMG